MIDPLSLPCYVRVLESGVYLIHSINTSYEDIRYYDDVGC